MYIFPEMKLRGLIPNSYIHVSVSDLYISRISLPIWLKQNWQTDPWNICISRSQIHECGIGRQNIIILFWKYMAAQFHFWEYIKRNLTFIFDSHRPCTKILELSTQP